MQLKCLYFVTAISNQNCIYKEIKIRFTFQCWPHCTVLTLISSYSVSLGGQYNCECIKGIFLKTSILGINL